MNGYQPGDSVQTPDGTLATYIKDAADGSAVIQIGYDTRLANPATLRKVQ